MFQSGYVIISLMAESAGAMAVFTAYVRLLGGALGLKQDYVGPMTKQQRMATATAGPLWRQLPNPTGTCAATC
jgi:hypothetical protein